MSAEAVIAACEYVGTASALAKQLEVSSPTVFEWRTGKVPLPIKRCVQIEQITNGAVDRTALRPGDWWLIWPELAEKFPERIPVSHPSSVG